MSREIGLICPTCGYKDSSKFILVNEASGIYECPACHNNTQTDNSLPDVIRPYLEKAVVGRVAGNFDEAETAYSVVLEKFPNSPAANWGMMLCELGISVVKDPKTGIIKPTCNRASFEPVFDNKHYQAAVANAESEAEAESYQKQGAEIDRIRRNIISLANKKEAYDVFICYKKTGLDKSGNEMYTEDSKIAKQLYDMMTEDGYKVFFAEQTLRNVAGEDYEPIIFNALYKSKLMVLVCSSKEYLESTWVKNEWMRFLKQMENDSKKKLIPVMVGGMSAGLLPTRLSSIQGMVMDATFEKEFMANVRKSVPRGLKSSLDRTTVKRQQFAMKALETVEVKKRLIGKPIESIVVSPTVKTALTKAQSNLNNNKYPNANKIYDQILQANPKQSEAMVGKAYCALKVNSEEGFIKRGAAIVQVMGLLDAAIENYDIVKARQLVGRMEEAFYLSLRRLSDATVDWTISLFKKLLEYNDAEGVTKLSNIIYKYCQVLLQPSNVKKSEFESIFSTTTDASAAEKTTDGTDAAQTDEILHFEQLSGGTYLKLINASNSVIPSDQPEVFADRSTQLAELAKMRGYFRCAYELSETVLEKVNEGNLDAIWIMFMCRISCKNNYSLANHINKKNIYVVEDTLNRLLTAGYVVGSSNENYFEYVFKAVMDLIHQRKFDIAGKLFGKVISYEIPVASGADTEYTHEKMISYADALLIIGNFKEARKWYTEVLAQDAHNQMAHWGLLKVNTKSHSEYELLLKKELDDNVEFNTTLTLASEGNENSVSVYQRFYDKYLQISEDKHERAKVKKCGELVKNNIIIQSAEDLLYNNKYDELISVVDQKNEAISLQKKLVSDSSVGRWIRLAIIIVACLVVAWPGVYGARDFVYNGMNDAKEVQLIIAAIVAVIVFFIALSEMGDLISSAIIGVICGAIVFGVLYGLTYGLAIILEAFNTYAVFYSLYALAILIWAIQMAVFRPNISGKEARLKDARMWLLQLIILVGVFAINQAIVRWIL